MKMGDCEWLFTQLILFLEIGKIGLKVFGSVLGRVNDEFEFYYLRLLIV